MNVLLTMYVSGAHIKCHVPTPAVQHLLWPGRHAPSFCSWPVEVRSVLLCCLAGKTRIVVCVGFRLEIRRSAFVCLIQQSIEHYLLYFQ